MFKFRHQPLKTFFLIYSIFTILLFRLPFWLVSSAIPSRRPRKSWSMSRALAVHFIKAFLGILYSTTVAETIAPEKDAASAHSLGFVWVQAIADQYIRREIASIAKINAVGPVRVHGYWFGNRATDGSHAQKAELGARVLYHFHGGSYVRGSGSPKAATATIPNGILAQCPETVDRAFCIDYRLSAAPPFKAENPFPAALIDALSGYYYLLKVAAFQPENIIISGDSAGGHLAISLVRYLIQLNDPDLPLPRALLVISPTVDWACTHDEFSTSSMYVNARSDFVGVILTSGYSARGLLGNLPWEDIATNAYLSPASLKLVNSSGIFAHFPPTCIVVGGAEQTRDPVRTLRDRLVADTSSSNVLYLEYEDAFHDFIGVSFHEPERSMALSEIQKWLQMELSEKVTLPNSKASQLKPDLAESNQTREKSRQSQFVKRRSVHLNPTPIDAIRDR